MIPPQLRNWEKRLAHVLRMLRTEGYAYTSGRLPHQWQTAQGKLRCLVCGAPNDTAHVGGAAPAFIHACPKHGTLVLTTVATLQAAFTLEPPATQEPS